MDPTQELIAAATVAGLRDPDLLKVAKADLPPAEAMLDLVRRFPGAFHADQSSKFEKALQPKPYNKMTPEEQDQFCRKHKIPSPFKRPDEAPKGYDAMAPKEQEAFRRKHHLPEPIRGTGRFMRVY